jgi:regulator of sigma E protease
MLLNLLTVVVFLLMFSVLVAVHEWGHYLLARMFNMAVSEFSIGIGNPIVKTFRRKKYVLDSGEEQETKFNFRPVPLGGFVKIVGMEHQEDDLEPSPMGGFYSKPAWQRIIVLLAGPVFSLAFGLIVLTATFTAFGTYEPNNVVLETLEGQPAMNAGIKAGDRILEINGTSVLKAPEATKIIRSSNGEPISFKIHRGGSDLDIQVKPTLSAEERPIPDADGFPTGEYKRVPQVGIAFGADHIYPSFGAALNQAAEFPILQVRTMVNKFTKPKVLLENSTGMIGISHYWPH